MICSFGKELISAKRCYELFRVFFFQAEDGIRDHCVTGVQTCALPIYVDGSSQDPRKELNIASMPRLAPGVPVSLQRHSRLFALRREPARKVRGSAARYSQHPRPIARSEERRVGKECRSRWESDR